jgi:hypothetical protein
MPDLATRGASRERIGIPTDEAAMATTRDQLIADWQRRLAEAEVVAPDETSRPAWLTRLRLRLYRFLISLYGEGSWNGGNVIANDRENARRNVVVADQVLPPAGKPAKDESSIRSALQTFASGRDEKSVAGPLAAGSDHAAWIVVASTSWGLDPTKSASALAENEIQSRTVGRANEITVEVRSLHQDHAMKIIQSQFARLTIPPRPQHPLPPSEQTRIEDETSLAGGYFMLGLMAAPLLGVVAVGLTDRFWPEYLDAPEPSTLFGLFGLTWIGSSLLMGLVYLLFCIRRAAVTKSPHEK